MTMRAETAWLVAKASTDKRVEELTPQLQYALRRVGGSERLESRQQEFIQAWNEAPVVDADLNTIQVLVRPLDAKDGVL